jgi:hypothetical protein
MEPRRSPKSNVAGFEPYHPTVFATPGQRAAF